MYENLVSRFITFAKFETRSDEQSTSVPSTPSQEAFSKEVLIPELEKIKLQNIFYNPADGFVTATLPANSSQSFPTIGFIAHVDTADFNATDVQPQFHENYDGEDIVLNWEKGIVLSPKDFPALKHYVGQTLVTTDGNTLLGADDKAGIAEIITALEIIQKDESLKHGDIKVAFGPDEEIGRGADLFDVKKFGCDFAYTMDGGPVGELQYESFHAAQAVVSIQGKNVHPGTAKDTMVNAIKLAMDFDRRLPAAEVPEKTEKREGFYHVLGIEGSVEESQLVYIIRDHDREAFEAKKTEMERIAQEMNEELHAERIKVSLKDQYYNMGEILEQDMRPVQLAERAMKRIGIEPIIEPVRGGTDGSKLSYMGLPTPNIFAGGENFHGRYEYIAVESMEKATEVIVEIIRQSGYYEEL